MANHQSISLTLVSPDSLNDDDDTPDSDSDDWLRLEQTEWQEPPDGGFFAWMIAEGKGLSLATINEYWSKYKSFCSEDGALEVEIQVHRSRDDLEYTIHASYGELSAAFSESSVKTESVDIDFADSYELDYSLVGSVSAAWEGPVLALDGAIVTPPPTITQDGNVLSWGQVVAGVLRLSYTAEYELYILTIVPRTDYDPEDLSTAYQSTVWAVWGEAQIERLTVELPDLSGNCSGGGGNIVDPDDDDGDCYKRIIVFDPCNLAVPVSDTKVPMECPEEDEEEEGAE